MSSLAHDSDLQIQATYLRKLSTILGKGELYRSTQAILRVLVAPGVPNGTPAVMTTR